MDYAKIKLSTSESSCIYWVIRGKTANEIATILGNSQRTVEKHLSSFRAKFHCTRLSQAITMAERLGFICNGEVFRVPLGSVKDINTNYD